MNLSPRQFQQRNLVQIIENALKRERAARAEPGDRDHGEHADGQLRRQSGQAAEDSGAWRAHLDRRLWHRVLQLLVPAAVSGGPVEDRSELREEGGDGHECRSGGAGPSLRCRMGSISEWWPKGVETDEQLRFLLRRKCDEAQGNFVARPVPAREFCATVHAYSSNLSVLQNAVTRQSFGWHCAVAPLSSVRLAEAIKKATYCTLQSTLAADILNLGQLKTVGADAGQLQIEAQGQ